MGIEVNTYIGPYIRVSGWPREKVERGLMCSACNIKSYDKGDKFCSKCGEEKTVWSEDVEVDFYALMDGLGENALRETLVDYCTKYPFSMLIPNFKGWNFLDSEDGLELTIEKISDKTRRFKEKHEREIQLLEENCDSVYVMFGCFEYWI